MRYRLPSSRTQKGFSLVELIVTVGVLGIITGIAITYYGGTLDSSKRVVAKEMAETLNLGLKKHAQVNYAFNLAANDSSADDETAIVRSLQFHHPTDLVPGAPFVRPNWHPVASNSAEEFRLRWNGRIFLVVEPGTAGTGLKVAFQASDYGENYDFPDDFVPVGG